jgi:cytochrome c oxidase assembly factor CtaG
MAVLIATLVPPLDPLADQLFSLHMVQHLLITLVGVPLVVFGAPYAVILRGLPGIARRRVILPLARSRSVHRALRILRNPVLALLLYEAAMWVWHVPRMYDAALGNSGIHLLEHGCMALTALNLWRVIIDPYPLRSKLALPARILVLAALTLLDTLLSAALTFSAASWYAYGDYPSPNWWPLGRLADQRLGGLIMWVPGGLIELTALAVTFAVWARVDQESV